MRQNRRRTPRRSRRSRRPRRFNMMLNGRASTAPLNPRASAIAPWNTIVLQRTVTVANSSTFSISPTYLRDALLAQLNLSASGGDAPFISTTFSLRPLSVEFHDLAGRPIEARLTDYSSVAGLGNVATGISYPSRSGYSRLKLFWPKVISANAIPVGSTAVNTIIVSGTVGVPSGIAVIVGTSILVKIHMLWRTGVQSAPTDLADYEFVVDPTESGSSLQVIDKAVSINDTFHHLEMSN